ncbi:nucleotide disphospho-sugar-binding domain-containing protein [Spirosoma montaniterrae]|uniref:Erythromycin biosynthesis protein CIII-like C-terminal domain-containing protein n=1 Tax=Spirosoma montaniterrae TaxID=1178516 RepID=A0A1P9WYA3_9BACT|nr:glycosyltransferase [Spirosoma montaniterrae]AQG80362.1 hypothetical protein AWR27_14150 [Spirosoma montaniterrae]
MKTALFLMLPAPSHYTPCFGLANDLKQQGYRVVFAGTPALAALVQESGFAFANFEYMTAYETLTLKAFAGTLLKSAVDRRFWRGRYREFLQGIAAARHLYLTEQPDILYLDEHLNHYYPYFATYTDAVYLINTKLSTRRNAHIPPLNAGYIARAGWLSSLYSNYLWTRQQVIKWGYHLINTAAFLGRTDTYFHNCYIQRLASTVRASRQSAMYSYDALPGVKTLILMSDVFEYPWMRHLPDEAVLHYWNQPLQTADELTTALIAWKQPDKSLIYCSVGTLAGSSAQRYMRFIQQVIDAFGGSSAHQVIISTGRSFSEEFVSTSAIPANIRLVSHVDQQALLPYCDLMITHGGLNSVKESIAAAVPMLGIANPADKHKDTPGNIARIVYHQIGLRCHINDDAALIRLRAETILTDPTFKLNVNRMREDINKQSVSKMIKILT